MTVMIPALASPPVAMGSQPCVGADLVVPPRSLLLGFLRLSSIGESTKTGSSSASPLS